MLDIQRIPNRPLLSEIAYERIKALVLNGTYKQGEPLVIDDLAGKLGTSRTPVREAIILLIRDGLATSIPNKGTYVAGIDKKDILEIYEVRAVLEPLAIRLATPNIPIDELDAIQDQAKCIGGDIEAEENRRAFIDIDLRFHKLSVNYCDNRKLADILTRLNEQLYSFHIYEFGLPTYHLARSLGEHAKIAEAIRLRNRDNAEVMTRIHIESAASRFEEYLALKTKETN